MNKIFFYPITADFAFIKKQPPLPKGRGTTEGGGGIHNTYHHKEKVKLKYKIKTERTAKTHGCQNT